MKHENVIRKKGQSNSTKSKLMKYSYVNDENVAKTTTTKNLTEKSISDTEKKVSSLINNDTVDSTTSISLDVTSSARNTDSSSSSLKDISQNVLSDPGNHDTISSLTSTPTLQASFNDNTSSLAITSTLVQSSLDIIQDNQGEY